MKKFVFISLLVVIGFNASAIWYPAFLGEYFFGRLPGTRAEAMGKAYAPGESELSCVFKNPAGLCFVNNSAVEFAYASPYYSLKDAKYLFGGMGYTFNKYLTVAATMYRFDFGEMFFTNEVGDPVSSYTPYEAAYTFSLASQPIKDLCVGLNLNYFQVYYGPDVNVSAPFYPDAGVIKYFPLSRKGNLIQKIFVGQSCTEMTNTKMQIEIFNHESRSELPVISRSLIGYTILSGDSAGNRNLRSHEATIVMEYEDVLNSKYYTSIHIGLEYKLFNLFAFRFGYFTQKVDDYGYPVYNKSTVHDFTYGAGINIPLSLLTATKTPLTIKLDFASMNQTSYTNSGPSGYPDKLGKFTSLNFSLNYNFKKK